jgi:alpha-beta hydrolase superfamily lysophospholipase
VAQRLAHQAAALVAEDHSARKGHVRLALYRKHVPGVSERVLFLVHGSSQSARTAYDLDAGRLGDYSVMDVFANWGFDVWTLDHEGYGRSSRTEAYSTIAENVADLRAAVDVVAEATGSQRFAFFGTSSGAIRAGAFQNAFPQWVARMALSAFPWTGRGAPSLEKRRQRLAEWQASNRRLVDADYFRRMLTRDVEGLTDPHLGEVVAGNEAANGGDSVPNGSYVDMCINLPLVDPEKITCPVMVIRGDHDGITTDADTFAFFERIASRDKQLLMMSGQAHNITFGVNRHRFWYALRTFLEFPDRVDGHWRTEERLEP